jgi:hypothetical protein
MSCNGDTYSFIRWWLFSKKQISAFRGKKDLLFYESPQLSPNPSHLNSDDTLTLHFFNIHLKITLISVPRSPTGSHPQGSNIKVWFIFFAILCSGTCSDHPNCLDFTDLIILVKCTNYDAPHYIIISILLFLSFPICLNITSTLFSDTLKGKSHSLKLI